MATTSPTRIDDDVFEAARHAGSVTSRSASQQITHWARIGRELEASPSVSSRRIIEVLTGSGRYDTLSPEEQAVVRAGWSEILDARIAQTNLAEEYAAEGRSYAILDAEGNVVVVDPPPA
jgi:hypothetical protein